MGTIWGRALPILRDQLGERNYKTFIEPMRVRADEERLQLEVPSRFFQEWITRNFLVKIRDTVTKVSGAPAEIRIVIGAEASELPLPKGPLRAGAEARRQRLAKPVIGKLVPSHTFATFVVGESNRLAYNAAAALVREPGARFNPLFIHGGVGLGKTHLAHALAHEFLLRPAHVRLACVSAEAFMNNMITSLRQDQMVGFRQRYRELDLLILDDVQFLAGKERTQEEFFHTFNTLQVEGKQIVLTSDKAPGAIAGLEERLRNRLDGGLTVDIHPPTVEMRVAISERKAAAQGVVLPPEVSRLIADAVGPSVRELEGALTRVLAASAFRGDPVTLEAARHALAPFVRPRRLLSMPEIVAGVGAEFGISVTDLRSHRRAQGLVLPRQVAMYLCRQVAGAAYAAIGSEFGGRDHSTVMHAVREVERKRAADSATAAVLARLETSLQHAAGTSTVAEPGVGPPKRR